MTAVGNDTPPGYAQVVVRGADAFTFLQGQLTNDLRRLDREPGLLAAWCNPKGRVIALFRVHCESDTYRLALPAELGETVVRRLALFRFRAKVEFAIEPATAAILTGRDRADFDLAAWRRRNLVEGIPEIAAVQSEKFTPHMLNLDRLDALSLDKGCYTGQEVVARTHYRGATKRRMLRFRARAPVSAGQDVTAGERRIGEIVNAIDNDVLAVVPLDVAGEALSAGDIVLIPEALPYGFD